MVTAFFGRWLVRREGAKEAAAEAREVDRAKADEIRDRVDAVRREPVSVHPDDARGYRD
jgi:hypothetical protein